jgi:hypothetical protein
MEVRGTPLAQAERIAALGGLFPFPVNAKALREADQPRLRALQESMRQRNGNHQFRAV